jgi:hypothetical protein
LGDGLIDTHRNRKQSWLGPLGLIQGFCRSFVDHGQQIDLQYLIGGFDTILNQWKIRQIIQHAHRLRSLSRENKSNFFHCYLSDFISI